MHRVKHAIVKPIKTDLSGGGLNTFSETAKAYFSASLNKDKNHSFSDIELSKAINPFALTRAVIGTAGISLGYTINKVGSNTLPAQAAKAVLMTPFTTTAAILKPFSKIDEAAIAMSTAIAKSIENNFNTPGVAISTANTSSGPQIHDKSESESSDPFKITVTSNFVIERAHQESEQAKLSKPVNSHGPGAKHNLFSDAPKNKDSKKVDEENTKDQSKPYTPR